MAPKPHSASKLVDDFRRSLSEMRPDVALCMAQALFLMDVRDQLSDYATSTVLIQPSHDPVVPVAVGQYLSSRWPHAGLEVVDPSGHLPHLTAPEAVLAVLERVLPN